MVFSGYTLSDIWRMNLPGTEELHQYTDILVDGPYIKEQYEDGRKWAGSKNQQFHDLSDYYSPGLEYEDVHNWLEVRIDQGSIRING
jgi:anaerobic ribonucleoside-triphosphate reductase activating protein